MTLLLVLFLAVIANYTLPVSYSVVDNGVKHESKKELENQGISFDNTKYYYGEGSGLLEETESRNSLLSSAGPINRDQAFNSSFSLDAFNIVTAGDFGCSPRAQENVKEIELKDPELFLVLGDLSYKKTLDCWFEMTTNLEGKTKITIGNHESPEDEEIENPMEFVDNLLGRYNLSKPYYSFDYNNVHILVLDTQRELSVDVLERNAVLNDDPDYETYLKDIEQNVTHDNKEKNKDVLNFHTPNIKIKELLKKHSIEYDIPILEKLIAKDAIVPDLYVDNLQYKFAINDLERASNDPDIDWIIVMVHKPFYSSASTRAQESILAEKYHPIFDKYGVDLVLQAHNHFYERTFPLKHNSSNIKSPIADRTNNHGILVNPDGTIFTVVGTGGEKPYRISESPEHVVKQHPAIAGFLDIEFEHKILRATFYDIKLVCEEKESKKSDLGYDLESCKPRENSKPLEIIDRYIISKNN